MLFHYHRSPLPTHLVPQPEVQLGLVGEACGGPSLPPHSVPPGGDVLYGPNTTPLAGTTPHTVSPKRGTNPRKVYQKEGVPQGRCPPLTAASPARRDLPHRQAHPKQGAPRGECHPQVGVTRWRLSPSGGCHPKEVATLRHTLSAEGTTSEGIHPKEGAPQGGFNPSRLHPKEPHS